MDCTKLEYYQNTGWQINYAGKELTSKNSSKTLRSNLPFGEVFTEQRSTANYYTPYKFSGKEKDEETSYSYFGARYYMSDVSVWLSVDPLRDKYPSMSPYMYCAGNPIMFVDPHGDSLNAVQLAAQNMIRNTLTKEDAKYLKFDKNGNVDVNLLKSHKSNSENYNNLVIIATNDIWSVVTLADEYSYMDNNGEMSDMVKMSYFSPDPEYADPYFDRISSLTTGETGNTGQTLLPGKGESGKNSPDDKIHIIINKNLSEIGRSEAYSHEGNGHALMFILSCDRKLSGHIFIGTTDSNIPLRNMILKSRKETINNMKNR